MKNRTAKDSIVVLTIGHSTRELDTFIHALHVLIELAKQDRVALMCAEAVLWRCHRSLIADALVARALRWNTS